MKVAIILARGGSRRIPGKNIKPFHGKPIIAYPIETALKSALFDHVLVSTDSDEIAAVSMQYGAMPIKRPEAMARDEVGTQAVMGDALRYAKSALKLSVDVACCIYPCSPLMLTIDIAMGYTSLLTPSIDYAYSLGVDPLRDAGNWYWGRAQAFMDGVPDDPRGADGQPLADCPPNIARIVIPNDRVCDVNTEADWLLAERMYAALRTGERE